MDSQNAARPHRLLLIRFFSQGLLAAATVIVVTGLVLTRLERDNYLRHTSPSRTAPTVRKTRRRSSNWGYESQSRRKRS